MGVTFLRRRPRGVYRVYAEDDLLGDAPVPEDPSWPDDWWEDPESDLEPGSAPDSEFDSELDSALDSELDSALDSELDSALGSELDSALDSELDSALDSALGSELDSAAAAADTASPLDAPAAAGSPKLRSFRGRSAAIAALVLAAALVVGAVLLSGPRARTATGARRSPVAAVRSDRVDGAPHAPVYPMPSATRMATGRTPRGGSRWNAPPRRAARTLNVVAAAVPGASAAERPARYPAQALAAQRATGAPQYAAARRANPEFGFER